LELLELGTWNVAFGSAATLSNFIAIDLDSQGLYAVAGAARASARPAHALAWTGDDSDPPPPLTSETAKAIGEKLRERLKAAGVQPAPVLVAVGRDRVILKELKYPPVPPTEEPALVRFQAMKEMSESPDEVVLDYAPLGETGGERRSMAVVLRKEQLTAIQILCQAAGLKLAGVTPRPYATTAGLIRAFAAGIATPPDDKDDAVAVLTLSPAGGEFTVARRGEVTFTLAIPAPVVANDTMLVAQIRRNLTVYAGQHPGHPIRAVYLSEVDGPWAQKLRSALNVPVRDFDPLSATAPDVPEPLRGRFAGAVGLLAGRGTDALPINFVSPRQPQAPKDPAKRLLAFIALCALLVLVVGGGGGLWFVGAREDEVNQLAQHRDDLKDKIAKNGPDATRVKGLDGWSKREIVWLDELYDLADRMPADDSVRVSSFTTTPIAPGKDGKQTDGNARVEVKLAAKNVVAANTLESAFVRDNTTPNRFYIGTNHVINTPLPAASAPYQQSITLITKVNHREPKEYERNTKYTPKRKTSGGAGGGTAVAPPAPGEVAELAPEPREAPR
jgi:hypothetical protein